MKTLWQDYKLNFTIMRHPFEGFYAMKFGKKGKLRIAFINFFLLWLSVAFMSQYSSLIVSQRHPLGINSFYEGMSLFGAIFLWSAANWSVTCLWDGEGKFKEIIMSICYSLTPIILTFIPLTIISNFMAFGEEPFFFLVRSIAIAFFVFLAFIGMITVHNFTVVKAVFTIAATIFALLVIAFLASLLFTLWQQLFVFVLGIVNEIRFR